MRYTSYGMARAVKALGPAPLPPREDSNIEDSVGHAESTDIKNTNKTRAGRIIYIIIGFIIALLIMRIVC